LNFATPACHFRKDLKNFAAVACYSLLDLLIFALAACHFPQKYCNFAPITCHVRLHLTIFALVARHFHFDLAIWASYKLFSL